MFEDVAPLPEWHSLAMCRSYPHEWWNYEDLSKKKHDLIEETLMQINAAIKICNECPVKAECLEQGLETENMHAGTIWGGLTHDKRKQVRRRRRNANNLRQKEVIK